MIEKILAWFILWLFINGGIALWLADPSRGHEIKYIFVGLCVLEVFTILICGAVYAVFWAFMKVLP